MNFIFVMATVMLQVTRFGVFVLLTGNQKNGISVPQNSTATRALQFNQPPHQEGHKGHPRESAFEAYAKPANQSKRSSFVAMPKNSFQMFAILTLLE